MASKAVKIQGTSCAIGFVAFAILFLSTLQAFANNRTPDSWYFGLALAGAATALLIAGIVRASVKREERKSLAFGIPALVAFVVVGFEYAKIAMWIAEMAWGQ